jgi:hypothetical protein
MVEMKDQLNERWDRLAVKSGDTMEKAMDLINKGSRDFANSPPTGRMPPMGGGRGLGYGPSAPRGAKQYDGEGEEEDYDNVPEKYK